jgi:hypothetical protein
VEKSIRWSLLVVAAVAIAAAAYYVWQGNGQPPAAVAPLALPAPAPIAAPAEHYAVAPPSATETPLPALDASDEAIGDAVADALGRKSLPAYFYPDRIVRRFVATVDNLPRLQTPIGLMPVKPVAGAFAVSGTGDAVAIDAANAGRYLPYVEAMQRVDAAKLVDVYLRFYPLFQQAYRELGYPKGYFNDRLVEALDDLLDAPVPPAPVALAQPKVLYVYADPELEARSAGQKIMVRMGNGNAARVKASLQAIRRELVRRTPLGGAQGAAR